MACNNFLWGVGGGGETMLGRAYCENAVGRQCENAVGHTVRMLYGVVQECCGA
jgi:hypothetical protein